MLERPKAFSEASSIYCCLYIRQNTFLHSKTSGDKMMLFVPRTSNEALLRCFRGLLAKPPCILQEKELHSSLQTNAVSEGSKL